MNCFACGGSHHAKYRECPGSNVDCFYNCVACKTRNNISSRGQSSADVERPSASPAPPAEAVVPPIAPKPSSVALPTRKRPASAASSAPFQRNAPALSFEDTWASPHVRKSGRFGCIKDISTVMDTVKAGRSAPTIGQRIVGWAGPRQFNWPEGQYQSCAAFGGARGGGVAGLGCTKRAAKDIYERHS